MNVLLIHGLSRTSLSMWRVGRFFRSHHHQPHFFGYWAWKDSYEAIVEDLRLQIEKLATQGEYCIVAHSLGGLLSRSALVDAPAPQHLFMLGTPNQPPRLATIAGKVPAFEWFTQDCGTKLSQKNFYQDLPSAKMPYTIIAGTKGPTGGLSPFGDDPNDGIVAVQETLIHEGDRPLLVPTFHTFMMNHPTIQNAILRSLNALS